MYFTTEKTEFRPGKETWSNITLFDSLDEAKEHAMRKASKSKGAPEQIILNQVGITSTSLPTEVTVTING